MYKYLENAGFGNFVCGFLTLYTVAMCKGVAFKGGDWFIQS